jgi:hypothetical protein
MLRKMLPVIALVTALSFTLAAPKAAQAWWNRPMVSSGYYYQPYYGTYYQPPVYYGNGYSAGYSSYYPSTVYYGNAYYPGNYYAPYTYSYYNVTPRYYYTPAYGW